MDSTAEERMFKTQCRISIALAAILVAMMATKSAKAQGPFDLRPTGQPGSLVNNLATGTQYDIVNQAKAERRLERLQVKLSRDAANCDKDARERDLRWIERTKYRIAVDRWLIRKNLLVDPGYYPNLTDVVSVAAIAQVASPPQSPIPRQSSPVP